MIFKLLLLLIPVSLVIEHVLHAPALEAELVSSALEATSEQIGVTTFFPGITVLAVVGNAAE